MTAYVEDDCKVVFIDRAGYGLSDDTDEDMTLSFIVEDYRKALQNAGIEGPYVLLPHSIGGAYATYWCSLYPEEIEGIVFLDGTQLSEHVFEGDSEEKPGFSDKVASLKARLGFRRDEEQFDYRNYGGNYTEDEQKMRAAMFYRTYDSIASYMEYGYHVQNCQEAFRLMVTTEDIPKIYISSSWGFDDEAYEQVRQALLVPYLEKLGNCELVLMPGDHLIYMDRPDDCGMLLRAFIDGLDGE